MAQTFKTNITVDGSVTATSFIGAISGALSSDTTSTQDGYFGNIYLYDDSTPSHYLGITNGANLTAARTLTINTGDADRTLTLTGNASITGTNTGDQVNITGNAGTATNLQNARLINGTSFNGSADITTTKWGTARTISLTGDVTGSLANVDGSGNISIATTIAANSVALGTDTTGNYVAGATAGQGITITGTAGEGWSPTIALTALDLTLFPTSNFKKSVKVATTANITLSGTQTIDGIAVVAGDRVLVKDQTTSATNGIYIVAAGAWTRSVAADGSTEIDNAIVAVDQGTTNGGQYYTNTFKTTDVVGTTAMPWYRIPIDAPGYIYQFGISGNAATATSAATLTTARTINGTSFNGSANITTATWGTARSITLTGDVTGSVASVNGGANISITTTIAANSVALGTDTTGNYVGDVTAGTGITIGGSAGEGTSRSIGLIAADLTLFPTSNFKKSVKAATTANITLSAPQTIDGIALVAGDRVLVKDQTTSAQNGIYIVQAAAWTRSVAADGSTEIDNAIVAVDQGTTNGGQYYTNMFKTTDVVGTTAMPWYRIPIDSPGYTYAFGISGNAGSATILQTTRTINGVNFNGSANITITANTPQTLTRGTYLTGSNFNGGTATTWAVDATSANTASKVVARDASGNFSAGTITASLSGNATTATSAATLTTARTINGTSFNGSANITTANWGTARTLTIGNTGKSVNGSANVSWSLAEIGALGATAKAADSELLDGLDSTQFSRVYRGTASFSNAAFVNVFNVSGDALASAVRFSVQGTTGNVVVNVLADLLVNHYQDILITTQSGFYTTLSIRVQSNENESYSVLMSTNSANVGTFNIEVFPLNNETITFGGTATTGVTLTHVAYYGTSTSGTGGNSGDIRTAGSFIGNLLGSSLTWANARTLTIGNTGKSVNGSSDVSWSLSEIGALGATAKAADSELLDGIDSSRVIYGENSTGSTSITNATLDTALKSGFYTVGTGGIPNATAVNFVLHTAYNGVGNLAGFDLACNDSTTSSFYLRPATGAGKGTWQTIITSANIGSQSVSSATSAATLTTARTINGTSFNGSANITTANWGTARLINGVSINGSTDYTVEPYVERDDSTNALRYLTFVDNETAAYKRLNMDIALKYNPSTDTLIATNVSGTLLGGFNTSVGSQIVGSYTGAYTTDASPQALLLSNTSASTAAQVMKIRTSSSTSMAAISFWNLTTLRGHISVTGSGTTYNSVSDYRLKENIVDLENAAERLMNLKPRRFSFIGDNGRMVDGFLAHEAQDVVPEAVEGQKDAVDSEGNPAYQGIDQSKLIPLLTAALQDALKRIEILESKINNLT